MAFESGFSTGASYTAIPITPSDTVDIVGGPVRWVDVTGTGDIAFHDARGNTVTLSSVPAGYQIKCIVKRVLAIGTTATGFIGYP
ncbi:MAG: hypothetical protein A3H25_02825 [Sphingomonadales bacterium RIFCSPLOWO2_12_FULL_63_15]|nr:MAG: hypothetical protein A3H25_02825 [Sphingomonadales bacterium RIFCSPLOWO2_12_FULL_63_15]